MHAPSPYVETRRDVLLDAARSIRFATLVACRDGRPLAAHIPLIPKEDGGRIVIEGHFARANPIRGAFADGAEALAIFRGPHAYVHPRWYPAREDGRVLPTWNYVAVEARGFPRLIGERGWLLRHLTELVEANEVDRPDPWSLKEASRDHVEDLLPEIMGVRLEVTAIEGVWKMSQDHPEADRAGVAAGLESEGTGRGLAVAGVMRSRVLPEEGNDP